jgi:uncharacterized protein (DUF1501 family)
MHIDTKQSRRAFMRYSTRLGAVGAAAPLLSSLGLISEAAAAEATDYKAIVCVFLYGGNDSANTLVPYDTQNHAAYAKARPKLAISRSALAANVLPADLGGRQYALNPALAALLPIYKLGKLAPVVNIGALREPTSKLAYERGAVRLPPGLFSHNDQQSFVQAFNPEGARAGWGGRMGDLLRSSNGTSALTCVTLAGSAVFLSGESTRSYALDSSGVLDLLGGGSTLFYSSEGYNALLKLLSDGGGGNWLGDEHVKISRRALELKSTVKQALSRAPASNFGMFPSGDNPLSAQLKMVARMISQGPSLGLRRQVFFVGMGGWDMHSGLLGSHPRLLGYVGSALAAFYKATEQMGVTSKVTTFTASDFGRTLRENGDGSDHGWGGNQFVMGGAIKGGKIYGTPPITGINTSDDVGGGRLIPTTSIDQLAATLGLWFGLPTTSLPELLPNLFAFDRERWSLGLL